MSKGTNCVIIYSVILVILFIVFCFLMTIVNPEPLKLERSDDGLTEAEVKLENIIFDEVLLPPVDNAMYGLEKADTEPTGMRIATKSYRRFPIVIRKSSVKLNFTTQRVRPPIWAPTTDSMNSTNESMRNTSHIATRTTSTTIANTEEFSTEMSTTYTTPPYETTSTEVTDVSETTEVTESNTETTETPIKGRRRSIEDNKGLANDSVILRIIDDSGQIKIEIKLGNKGLLNGNNEHTSHDTESKFNIGIEKNNVELLNTSKLARNSTIQLLANKTVVIDEYEDFDLNDGNQDINRTIDINMTTTNIDIDFNRNPLDITTNPMTDYGDVFLKLQNYNNTNATPIYTEMYALKVLIDNETKSFTNLNRDVLHITTMKDIVDENVNDTEMYATNTESCDVNNNTATIEKSYNYQDVITVL